MLRRAVQVIVAALLGVALSAGGFLVGRQTSPDDPARPDPRVAEATERAADAEERQAEAEERQAGSERAQAEAADRAADAAATAARCPNGTRLRTGTCLP